MGGNHRCGQKCSGSNRGLCRTGESGYYIRKAATDKGNWFMFDVALAMQNLVLVARSWGLGMVHVGQFDAKKAEAILEVPAGFCVVEMTPLLSD